ncbi:BRO-N domain-containing protein [Pseudomonas solani]|uniref:BRO-N domain-containing protein n=1 Tax=Pseudomonas solani TaxID=2731552 RepID=UPI003F4ABDD7
MKFEKRNFMGIELDVLVGHPEHDLLFVATQVARAAGLKNPGVAVQNFHNKDLGFKTQVGAMEPIPNFGRDTRKVPLNSWLFDEPRVYAMLMKGTTDKAHAFQKWVTEEVLPSIRKTGKYSAEDSQNPIALAIMDELKSLRGEIAELRQELQAKTFNLTAPAAEVSPYEGQAGVALCDPAGFNVRLYRELGEEIIPRPAVDRLESRVILHLEIELSKKWDEEDGRKLKDHHSRERRKWRLYPKDWLNANLTRPLYIAAINAVIAEKLSA